MDTDTQDFDPLLIKKKKKRSLPVSSTPLVATEDADYTYVFMLQRLTSHIKEKKPDMLTRRLHKLPPPEMSRVGTKMTMWANFASMCGILCRPSEHVISFVMSELNIKCSLDGHQRLMMKGRFAPKHIESILRKYISTYVICATCKSHDTTIYRDPVNRLYFIQCSACESKRSVEAVTSGYCATTKADRKVARAS